MRLNLTNVAKVVREVKKHISDEYRAFDEDEIPGIQLTVATTDGKTWDWQTGDNSYSGPAYHYRHWAIVGVYRRSDSRAVARDILSQLNDLMD